MNTHTTTHPTTHTVPHPKLDDKKPSLDDPNLDIKYLKMFPGILQTLLLDVNTIAELRLDLRNTKEENKKDNSQEIKKESVLDYILQWFRTWKTEAKFHPCPLSAMDLNWAWWNLGDCQNCVDLIALCVSRGNEDILNFCIDSHPEQFSFDIAFCEAFYAHWSIDDEKVVQWWYNRGQLKFVLAKLVDEKNASDWKSNPTTDVDRRPLSRFRALGDSDWLDLVYYVKRYKGRCYDSEKSEYHFSADVKEWCFWKACVTNHVGLARFFFQHVKYDIQKTRWFLLLRDTCWAGATNVVRWIFHQRHWFVEWYSEELFWQSFYLPHLSLIQLLHQTLPMPTNPRKTPEAIFKHHIVSGHLPVAEWWLKKYPESFDIKLRDSQSYILMTEICGDETDKHIEILRWFRRIGVDIAGPDDKLFLHTCTSENIKKVEFYYYEYYMTQLSLDLYLRALRWSWDSYRSDVFYWLLSHSPLQFDHGLYRIATVFYG